jgi:hypothetical protein
VILAVMLVVLMMAGLATFAVQTASFESRSVAGGRQLQRLRRAAESFAVFTSAWLAERAMGGVAGLEVADNRWVGDGEMSKTFRAKYGLPAYAADTSLYQLRSDNLAGTTFPLGTKSLPKDSDISAGAVTPFSFDGHSLIELYRLPADEGQGIGQNNGSASGQTRYRAVITSFTSMFLPPEMDGARTLDVRQLHEAVATARGFYDLR